MGKTSKSSHSQPGRNDLCPCGSGKKYKNCCGNNIAATRQEIAPLFQEAFAQFEMRNLDKALEICNQLLKSSPRNADTLQLAGIIYGELQQYEKAASFLEKARKLQPSNPWIHQNLASALLQLGKLDEAYERANSAAKLNRHEASAWISLGKVLEEMEKFDEARDAYQTAKNLGADEEGLSCSLAQLSQRQGHIDEARMILESTINNNPDSFCGHSLLGLLLYESRDFTAAHRHLSTAVELNPMVDDVLNNYGLVLRESGHGKEALEVYQKIIRRNPEYRGAYINLANVLADQGDYPAVRAILKEGLRRFPHDKSLTRHMIQLNIDDREISLAIEQAQQLVRHHPDDSSAYELLAKCYEFKGDMEAAFRSLNYAISINPESASLFGTRASMEEKQGNLDAALRSAEKAVELDSENLDADISRLRVLRRKAEFASADELAQQLDARLAKETSIQKIRYLYERGELSDRERAYDQAFKYFEEAAHLNADYRGIEFSIEDEIDRVELEKELVRSIDFSVFPHLARDRKKVSPLFIVGFPRSGTTLLERLLVAQGEVAGGDELFGIRRVSQQICNKLGSELTYPHCLPQLATAENAKELLASMRDVYYDHASQFVDTAGSKKFFTDKLPLNLIEIPLISVLFPDSPIIHIRRNPMDAVLSTFFSNIGDGENWYVYDIRHTAVFYKLVMELVEEYKGRVPMRYTEIRYEDMVEDPEHWSRFIAEFVGIEWREQMLEFHQNSHVARTASYAQVKEKIYTSSVSRYKNYEKHLSDCLEILGPTMERYHYLDS